MITAAGADRVLWTAWEDGVRSVVLPVADLAVIFELAADLRPGSGGRWEGLPAACEARRALLLADLVERGEELGVVWPFEGDALPGVPDSPPSA